MSSSSEKSERSRTLPVHLVQMCSVDNSSINFEFIKNQIRALPTHVPAAGEAAHQLVSFPENAAYMRLREGAEIQAFDLSEDIWSELSALANEKNAILHLGSVALKGSPDEPASKNGARKTNSSVTIQPNGQVLASYSKIHLFDITLEGQPPIRESDAFAHGVQDELLRVGDWVFGQSICYDIRFSELYRRYAEAGVDAILVPAAFLVQTGKAHWEVLLRARAIESQAYVLAAAQAGRHLSRDGAERFTYGHSLVVSPWGEVLKDAGPSFTGTLSFVLERENLEKVRRQIPMQSHRRLR